MSSQNIESLKKPAEESTSDEPNAKRVKVIDTEGRTKNNGNDEKVANDDKSNKIPTKAVNGNADTSKQDSFDSGENLEEEAVGFDPKIAKSLEKVELIQQEICNLNERASEEILKVEQEFNKHRRPYYEKRDEILKEIPNFWVTTLANHPIVAPMIESDEDEDCLHHMVSLDVEEFEDIKSGYKLKLHFRENPYIANEVIVKEFRITGVDESAVSGSTPINYKDSPQGRALKQIVDDSVSQYRRSRGRPGLQGKHRSFFSWLVEPCESGDEVAEILKDQIWPNPLDFFFTTAENYGVDEEDSDEEFELNEEGSEEDEEDIEEDAADIPADGFEYSDEDVEGEDDDDGEIGDLDDEEDSEGSIEPYRDP